MRIPVMVPAALLVAFGSVAACSVPGHMHVTEGAAPQNVDTDVRFRTTYYFRVFDYCWSANAPLAATSGIGAVPYRQIIPQTDTLYRYRMTGKSSALFNEIKFESGILDKGQIDPFGTDVVYNSDIGGFLVRDQEQARNEAEAIANARAREAGQAAALQRFEILSAIYQNLPDLEATDPQAADVSQIKVKLVEAMGNALAAYTGTASAQLSQDVATEVGNLATAVQALSNKLAADGVIDPATKSAIDALEARVNALESTGGGSGGTLCPPGEIRQKGFQVMGPEGMKPFNQEERLIMAMYTGAKPLTETLQEYSSRILKPRANPAEQLLPLVRENLLIVEAMNAAERAEVEVAEPAEAASAANAVFDAALTAFEGR